MPNTSGAPDCSGVRVVIACGGTGGHFYPTLSIAEAVRNGGGEPVLFISGHHAAEHLRMAAENGFAAEEVPAVRLPNSIGSLAAFPFRFLAAILAARRLLRVRHPDLVLAMGSFAAAPAGFAAVLMRCPLVLHEGNSWMGRANRWLAPWARAVAVSLPLDAACTPRCRVVRTGMPLRQALLTAASQQADSATARLHYGLSAELPTLLVFGGSQGARAINNLFIAAAPGIANLNRRIQIIHFTGTDENEAIVSAYSQAGIPAVVQRGDPHIEHAYRAADLVVCRGGASSLSELFLFAKPAIVIPFPSAAEDHQRINARIMSEQRTVRMLEELRADRETLEALLGDWLADPEAFAVLGRNAARFAAPNAANDVAELLADSVKKS